MFTGIFYFYRFVGERHAVSFYLVICLQSGHGISFHSCLKIQKGTSKVIPALGRKIYRFGFFCYLKSVPCQASLLNGWAKGNDSRPRG